MTTSIALAGGTAVGLLNRDELAKSLNNASMSMPTVGGDKQYIKMLTKGRDAGTWVYGQQETEVEGDSLWAINPMSIKHGYVAWDTEKGGAPIQEVMLPINRPLPAKDTLPELPMSTPDKKGYSYQLEYQDQRSFDAVCISGEDAGKVTAEYKQSSAGAMKLFGKIINALLDQVQKGDEIVPVGKWGFSTYDHPKYNLIHNPEFEIVEWRTPADTSEPEAKEEAKEPVRERRTRAAAPEAKAAEPAAEEESDEDKALAAEYAAEQAAQSGEAAPRRRQRR